MTFMSPDSDEFEERRQALVAGAHEQRLRHDRFVSDLTKDQLTTFIEILQCFDGEAGSGYINFMTGRSAAVMEFKHNSCPGCGQDHFSVDSLDETRKKLLAEGVIKPPAPTVKEPEDPAMQAYGMIVIDGQLQCKGCGLNSIGMEDRMLRSPGVDGCSGCQQKSAFG